MIFLILLQFCTISLCLNSSQPKHTSELSYSTMNFSQTGRYLPVQNNESQTKLVDSSTFPDQNLKDLNANLVDDYDFYFTSCGEQFDGTWEFTPYDSGVEHLLNGTLSHKKGKIYSSIKCTGVPKFGSIMHIDIDLYDGDYKNKMYKFDIDFVQDFKNYTKFVLMLEKKNYNVDFSLYNFIHRSHIFNYDTNNTFVKRRSDYRMSIKIESSQKGFNGFIEINVNSIYLGRYHNFKIDFYLVWNLIVALMCFYCIHMKIVDVLEDDFSYMCLSPITLALSLAWNTLLLFEHFYLALTCVEYFRLYVSVILHLCMIVYQLYLLKFIYLRFKQKFICLQLQIFICMILLVLSMIVFSYDLLFDCRFLTIVCGFIWVPQIIQNARNGFTVNNDYLILSLTLNFLYFPLSNNYFRVNIFELQPNYEWMMKIVYCVLVQIVVCVLQRTCNCRFFIPSFLRKYCIRGIDVEISHIQANNFECVICLSDNEDNYDRVSHSMISKISCGHSFHYVCLGDYIKYKNECPLCRHKIFTPNDEYTNEI